MAAREYVTASRALPSQYFTREKSWDSSGGFPGGLLRCAVVKKSTFLSFWPLSTEGPKRIPPLYRREGPPATVQLLQVYHGVEPSLRWA